MTTNSELLGFQGATGDFFDSLQEEFGATLQGIHVDEKLAMLSAITFSHACGESMSDAIRKLTIDSDTPSQQRVFRILDGLEEFDGDRQLAFCAALLAQVQESYRLHQQFLRQLTKAGVEEGLASDVATILANGGERTQAECELVSQAWEQVFKVDKKLANRMDAAMGVSE
ncbi:MAG: hypothetical protein HC899_35490 [Leptolyngbyaceae cyanobacterium SM1_4_3]|nr:hypothetical protein [Leptolyngbyaceae cyanobacterium SM1_4_3]